MAGIRVGNGHSQAPRNVEEITNSAQDYDYDAAVSLRHYLRTAAALVKQAEIYQREGDDEMTYFLLFRHAHLVLQHLSIHPGIRDEALQPAWKEANDTVRKELELLDGLRPKIKAKYERYQKIMQERETRANAQQRRTSDDVLTGHHERDFELQRTRQMNAHENKDLAAKLAQREHSRRAATSTSMARADGDDMQRRLQAIRARVENKDSVSAVPRSQQNERQGTGYKYPTVPSTRAQYQMPDQRPTKAHEYHQDTGALPPALPPKYGLSSSQSSVAPARPDKVVDTATKPPLIPDTPSDERMFACSAFLENGTALRTIFLPNTLRTTFLRIAQKNTTNNLETCGFLVGTLMRNAFFVSKLVIPSQTATSDTCEMTNDSELFDYVDKHDLMTLGWIHTHPTQTCFMSSADLHTHAGYQMQLAESVAVVCAPSKGDTSHGGDYGVFRLTDPPGKKVILNCRKPGVFHPHEVDNIYTDALRPGHVVELQDMPFDLVDLR